MLTVKLMSATKHEGSSRHVFATKIVEGASVDVRHLRENELVEIVVYHGHGQNTEMSAFYVANKDVEPPNDMAEEITLYVEAYIENANGKTTQAVTFR